MYYTSSNYKKAGEAMLILSKLHFLDLNLSEASLTILIQTLYFLAVIIPQYNTTVFWLLLYLQNTRNYISSFCFLASFASHSFSTQPKLLECIRLNPRLSFLSLLLHQVISWGHQGAVASMFLSVGLASVQISRFMYLTA